VKPMKNITCEKAAFKEEHYTYASSRHWRQLLA